MATSTPTIIYTGAVADALPARLADALDALAQPLMTEDRECARILAEAREQLRCLAASRYAARKTRESRRRTQIRRLGAHAAAWRAR